MSINILYKLCTHFDDEFCNNFDFETGDICPPLLLNCPLNAITSLSCCIFNYFLMLSYFFFNLDSSFILSFICSSLPVFILFCKLTNSADCLPLTICSYIFLKLRHSEDSLTFKG